MRRTAYALLALLTFSFFVPVAHGSFTVSSTSSTSSPLAVFNTIRDLNGSVNEFLSSSLFRGAVWVVQNFRAVISKVLDIVLGILKAIVVILEKVRSYL